MCGGLFGLNGAVVAAYNGGDLVINCIDRGLQKVAFGDITHKVFNFLQYRVL